MKKLIERNESDQYDFHARIPVRVYSSDTIQADRISRTRRVVAVSLDRMQNEPSHKWLRVVELGCGTADVCGYFSWGHNVTGYDASPAAALRAQQRFPWMEVKVCDIQKLEPFDCDLLILTEVLEHLCDPMAFCEAWLPRARFAVLSCPLNGDISGNGDTSGKSHIWSVEPEDFKTMLRTGGRVLRHLEEFDMGNCYHIGLGASELVPTEEREAEPVQVRTVDACATDC
jgi:SAM-dependent methyltransferase